jgi:REP element-mobilizing transposase RayT
LVTLCVDGRARVLDNETTFQRLTAFLLDSPARYGWFPRRFVVMPDHLHLIAHQGINAVRLGQWVKALKAVVGGLERRKDAVCGAGSGDPAYKRACDAVGPVPPPGEGAAHEFTRSPRAWRWQEGFHDHKFRTPESQQRKWEYVCLNPVRGGLVKRPEQWPYGGEIYYEETTGPRLVAGIPPLLETGLLISERSAEDDAHERQ